jgi:hypothetical protein
MAKRLAPSGGMSHSFMENTKKHMSADFLGSNLGQASRRAS